MGLRGAGVACSGALLAASMVSASGCGQTIVEIVNSTNDGSVARSDASFADGPASSISGSVDDASVDDASGDDAAGFDATVGVVGTDAGTDAGSDAQGGFVGAGDAAPSDAGCPGPDLRCHVDTCPGQGTTSISGKVYDPSGTNPIPHAFVFVPTDPTGKIPAITPGARACGTCDLPIGSYVGATMSDATGSFTLTGVPTGTQIPVVFQVGKWRREVFVNTTSCQDTALSPSVTHLPSTQSQGNIPAMALLTGGTDDLGCLLARFGISPQEFSSPHAGGRLDVYQGLGLLASPGPGLSGGTAGNCTNSSCPLWSSKSSLEAYDIVLLACEGDTFDPSASADGGGLGGTATNVTVAGKQAMHDWLGEGGKLFATHYQYTWLEYGPADFQGVATWLGSSVGTGQGTYAVETSFPKAQDFRAELVDAGALADGSGLPLTGVASSVSSVNAPAQAWIEDPSNQDTKYFTFTTPLGGTCGKAAFSDLHAGGAPEGDVPGACTLRALTSQERAMELLFFDLSSCVSDDSKAAPGPPPSGS